MLLFKGKVWMDEVHLEVVGKAKPVTYEAPRPLSERGRDNLVAFTRLLGYVRHFYPGDEAARTDWNLFAITGVRRVEDAPDAAELAARLDALFKPIAPAMQVFAAGQAPQGPTPIASVGTPIKTVRWVHHGFGTGDTQNIYRSAREYSPLTSHAAANDVFTSDLGGGIACRMPLTLLVDAKGTLPRGTGQKKDDDYDPDALSGNDRATRLAAIALAWNIFQHFYPYFDAVKTDWPLALRDGLTSAAEDADERAFLDTLRRLVAALHDGHGSVSHNSDTRFALPPIRVSWAGESLVVAQVHEGDDLKSGGLKPGDLIRKIDGVPVSEAYQRASATISAATEQWRRYRALNELLRGPQGSPIALEAQHGAETPFTVHLTRQIDPAHPEKRPAPVAELKPGIWYLDLDAGRATTRSFTEALPKLAQARGVVFDLRGYPNEVALELLPHLAHVPITSALWNVPRITSPDHVKFAFDISRWPAMPPTEPHIGAKVAFLTDGRAISYAESVMGIVEHYKLGDIVGGPTAGTNGNVNPITLPGGYRVTWTGMNVVKHDGSQHHGVGIQPMVPVVPTVEGIAQGRDEVLEKAVEQVSR